MIILIWLSTLSGTLVNIDDILRHFPRFRSRKEMCFNTGQRILARIRMGQCHSIIFTIWMTANRILYGTVILYNTIIGFRFNSCDWFLIFIVDTTNKLQVSLSNGQFQISQKSCLDAYKNVFGHCNRHKPCSNPSNTFWHGCLISIMTTNKSTRKCWHGLRIFHRK